MREINTGVCKWRGQFFFMKSYIHTDIITRVLTRLLEGLHEYYFLCQKEQTDQGVWNTFVTILFQMKSTRCTLLLSVFISTSVHVSDNYVPIVRSADQTATHTE